MQKHTPEKEWLLSMASDTPFFPNDLADKLLAAAEQANTKIAVSCSLLQMQPIFSLWHISLLDKIAAQLTAGAPRIQEWVKTHSHIEVDFNADAYDPFFNINTPQDLYTAETLANKVV
jgi:molybdopterin-guanine dinucleotide biosynthesis protein A